MSELSNKKLLVDNTLWVYAGKIITQLLGLLATVLVIRKLPVDLYGTYLFIFGLFFVYQLFITSPLKNLILRFIPELIEKKNYASVKKLLTISVLLSYSLITCFSFLLYVFHDRFALFFNIDNFELHLIAFLIFVYCYALKVLSESIISSFLKHKISAQANVAVVIFRAASYLILLKYINVNVLLYIEAVGALIYTSIAGYGIFNVFKKWRLIPSENANAFDVKKRVRRFYLLSFFSELGYGIIGRTSDHYIIAAMSSPFYVGLYGFALKIFEVFYKVLPFREFESVLKPVFFKRFSKSGNPVELNEFYTFTLKVLLPLFMLPFLYFSLFGKGIIIYVFEAKYLPAFWVTCITLFGILINGVFYPLNFVIQLKERIEINLYSRIVVVFSIVAGIYFMKLFGIVGVATATMLGELFKNLFMLYMLKRYVVIKYSKIMLIRYGLLMMAILTVFIPFSSYYLSIGGLIIGSVMFSVFFVLLLLNIHPFSLMELEKLESVVVSSDKLKKLYLKFKPMLRVMVLKTN
ncbi:hypothetical protein E9993_08830 [Labilibacter sediminis]|nr:hypothetical protein E9993_08830 [Labilibacter sediminis]